MSKHLNQVKQAVVKKLFVRRVIGSHHIRTATLLKSGWKSHEKGLVKQAIHELIQEGLIIWAKKSEKAIILNKNKLKEIYQVVEQG